MEMIWWPDVVIIVSALVRGEPTNIGVIGPIPEELACEIKILLQKHESLEISANIRRMSADTIIPKD